MKKRGQETAEVFFRKLLEELKKAINSKKGGGKQKKKIQKGGKQNSTRHVEEILKDIALYINNNPDTISVLKGMVEKSGPNVKNAIKVNTELMNKLVLKEPVALTPEAKEIYYYASTAEIKVFDKTNNLIGTTTGTGARPGERSGGRALINLKNGNRRWLSGKCIQVENGIRFTEEIKYDDEFEHNPSAAPEPAPEPATQSVSKKELSDGIKHKLDNKVLSAKEAVKKNKDTEKNKLKEEVKRAEEKYFKAKKRDDADSDQAGTDEGVDWDKWQKDSAELEKAEKELKDAEQRLKAHKEKMTKKKVVKAFQGKEPQDGDI